LKGRIDLRNHRKIVIIDNRITYCGSQNCADPEFLIKAKFGPWVDIMVRFKGPIAIQNQYLFSSDWMHERDEDITGLLTEPPIHYDDGVTAKVIGTGPTVRYSAMPEIFESLMYTARKELVISTPYYFPDESMQAALCACGRRGIATTLIIPARNDSRIVGAASKSYYSQLLAAGVQLFEYGGGLLHAKTLTLDGEVTLIGSANMDRHSFELNYENNILVHDSALTAGIRARQHDYIADSLHITREMVESWSWQRRLINNAVAMICLIL
jgi:cardiolipin synthase